MNIKFLGTGTSTGVPEVGCRCKVCTSTDKRDNRLRSSLLIDVDDKRILIDCGPDFRQQMLGCDFRPIDGVLITHEHYDHVGGIDDVRPFCRFGSINIYAEGYVANALKSRIPYCFAEHKYPGIPQIAMNSINVMPFKLKDIDIIPIRLMHGLLPILGYRIKNIAYLTDLKTISEEEFYKFKNLDVLIMNALRIEEHISHQNLEQAICVAQKIGAKQTFFIHMSHDIGLHAEVERTLPPNMYFAYDGLELNIVD